ncbi:MAG: two-component sensor histidine kinase [Bacteroidia bacterium]|nr:two-component sensor histidine kinase [Bacteroidia bacterium]
MTKGMARPLLIFYILVAYVLLQFSWWAYLLIDLNKEVIQYRTDISELIRLDPAHSQKEKADFASELRKRILMVIGEGTVFLGLLVFGIYKTRQAFRKEFELARQQRNFLLSITHEFKSPLAAVKLNLQTMQKRELGKEQSQTIIRRSLIETERIHLLVENALFAARLESDNFELYFEDIDFSAFLQRLIREYVERQDHDHHITPIITPGVHIRGDQLALTSLLFNLLENAEKYSPEGTLIEIGLSRGQDEAIITVRDQGYGIPESERQRIFEKFYRVGNEDTRKSKGTGLGLFIVQHIVTLHKGSIQVRANHPAGSVFEIRLPAEK